MMVKVIGDSLVPSSTPPLSALNSIAARRCTISDGYPGSARSSKILSAMPILREGMRLPSELEAGPLRELERDHLDKLPAHT